VTNADASLVSAMDTQNMKLEMMRILSTTAVLAGGLSLSVGVGMVLIIGLLS
jgi:hypothetical protein